MSKCFGDIRDEAFKLHSFIVHQMANKVSKADFINSLNEQIEKLSQSYSTTPSNIELKEFYDTIISSVNSLYNKGSRFKIAKVDLKDYPTSFVEQEVQFKMQDQVLASKSSAIAATESRSEDQVNLDTLENIVHLLNIFGNNTDLMDKFLQKFKNDILDLVLFAEGDDPSFNQSTEVMNTNISNWKLDVASDLKADRRLIGLSNSEIALALANPTDNGVDSVYRLFVSKHFDMLLSLSDNVMVKKTKNGYIPAITTSLRKGWTDNEFIDYLDEMGDFTKEIIKSRKVIGLNGTFTGEYMQIDHLFNVIGKLQDAFDKTNPDHLKSIIEDVLKVKTNKRSLGVVDDGVNQDKINSLSTRDLNMLLSFYLHFLKPEINETHWLYKNGILKPGSEIDKIASFYLRSKNTFKKGISSSNKIDYYDLIVYNVEKQLGNSYTQVVYDNNKKSFISEDLNTNKTNKKKRQLLNNISFYMRSIFRYDKIPDILKSYGFELTEKDGVPTKIEGNGFILDLENYNHTIPESINEDDKFLQLFNYIVNQSQLIKPYDYLNWYKESYSESNFKNGLNSLANILSRSISLSNEAYTDDKRIPRFIEDNEMSEVRHINRALQDYSTWLTVVSGESVKSVTMTANDTFVPSYGLPNMIKNMFTQISFFSKYFKRNKKSKSPLKDNILYKNRKAILDPVTNTFISYKGKTTPIAKASSQEIFFNNFILQYLQGITPQSYIVGFQPTTYSDKSKQTAIRIDGSKFKYGRHKSLREMKEHDLEEMFYNQTMHYYSTAKDHVIDTLNKTLDTDFKKLSEIQNYINKNGIKVNDIIRIADSKGLQIFSTMFFTKNNINSFFLKFEESPESFIELLEDDMANSIALLKSENIYIDYKDVKSTIDTAIQGLGLDLDFEKHWVDSSTGRILWDKKVGNIVTVNPLYSRYFYEKNSFSEAFQHLIAGGVFSHPAKGAGKDLVEEFSRRYIAMTKRTVGIQATMHPYRLGLYNGVSYYDKIAFVFDPKMDLYNQLGNTKDQEITDGSSFSNYLSTILKNNSLMDQGGQVHHKSIGMMVDPESGCFMLMKHADHTMTNERIRNSKYAPYNLKKVVQKMLDMPFNQEIDITKNFDGYDILKSLKLKVKYKTDQGSETIENIIYKGNNTYDIEYTKYNSYGTTEKDVKKDIPINSLYELWLTLGGERSASFDPESRRMVYDDSSWFNLAEFVNHVGFRKNSKNIRTQEYISKNNIDYKAFRTLANDSRYDDDSKIEYEDALRPNADSIYQPLKDKFITQITFASAQKVGSTNVNSVEALRNDEPLKYYPKYSNMYTGLQLDHEHHIDDSEVTEPTQIISAIFFNGDASAYNSQISSAIKNYIVTNISNYLGSNQSVSDIPIDSIREIIGNQLIKELGKKDVNGLAVKVTKSIETEIQKLLNEANEKLKAGDEKAYNSKINQINKIDKKDVPFSDPGIYDIFVNSMSNLMTSLGIRRKLEGAMNVLSPQNYFITVHEKNGKVGLAEDFDGSIDLLETSKLNIKPFDTIRIIENENEERIVLDTYEKWTDYLQRDLDNAQILLESGAPRRQLPHRVQFDIENENISASKDCFGVDFSKLLNYVELINKYNKDENTKDKAKSLIYEWDYVINSNFIRLNIPTQSELYSSLMDKVKQALNGEEISLSSKDFNTLKNIELSNYKLLKEKSISFYSVEDVRDMIKNGKIQNVISDPNLVEELIASYNDPEAFYSALLDADLSVKISNYKELEAEVVMPANLGKKFFVAKGMNVGDVTLDYLKDKINNLVDKSETPFDYSYQLLEDSGDNIFVLNEESFANLSKKNIKLKPLYRFNGFSNAKTLIAKREEDSHYVGSTMFYSFRDPDTKKQYRIAVAKDSDIQYLNGFKDGEHNYRLMIPNDDTERGAEIDNYVNELYSNYQVSLRGMMCRIPSQSKQSGMPFKIVGFLNTENNISFVPAENLWLTGGDYDIDKIVQVLFSFGNDGLIHKISSLHNNSSPDMILESMALPLSNGVGLERGNDYVVNEELINRVYNINESIYNDISLDDFREFVVELNNIANARSISVKDENVFNFLNDYFKDTTYIRDTKSLENAIVGAMYHAYRDGRNAIHTYAPMDSDLVNDVLKKYPSPKEKKMKIFSPTNTMTDVLMQITNMVGKDGIAIAATGQKALAVIINRFLQIGKGKFNNIVLKTDLASEIADVIGEKADTIRIINGFDTKNIAPQIEEYLNNMFDDEMFRSGKAGKEEFIKNYMDNLYGEGDSSLIVSEILTKATDNAKELALDKMNASINTLGMYIYTIAMGVDLSNFTRFMTSPVIDKIIELSIPNLINKDKESANIDSAIREVRNGYRDAFRYDRRLASEISLTKAISKSLNIDIDKKDLKGESLFYQIIYGDGKWSEIRSRLLNDRPDIKYIEISRSSGDEFSDIGIDDILSEFDEDSSSRPRSIKEPFYKWLDDSITLKNSLDMVDGNERMRIANLFERIKKESGSLKVLGQMLGINQKIKSDAFDLYRYNSVLSNFINEKVSEFNKAKESYYKSQKVKYPGLEIFLPILKDGFDFNRFMMDQDYRERVITEYNTLTELKELNILEMLSSSDHFMEMINVVVNMNNFINKPNSVKHRSLSSLISRIEKSLIYGSYGNLPKSISEEIYRGLSNLIDDSIVQSFLNTNKIKVKAVNNDIYQDFESKKHLQANMFTAPFNLNTFEGRYSFTSWFEGVVLSMKQSGIVRDENGNEVRVQGLQSNLFIQNIQVDASEDRLNGMEYYYIKPALNYDPKLSDKDKLILNEMVKGLKDLKDISYAGYKFHDLLFLYDLITNRNKKNFKSFSYFTSEAFDISDSRLLANKYMKHINALDQSDEVLDISDDDLKNRGIAPKRFGDAIEGQMSYKLVYNPSSNRMEKIFYDGKEEYKISMVDAFTKNIPLSTTRQSNDINLKIINKMFKSLGFDGEVKITC